MSQARHDLSRLLAPSAIALVGASSNAQVTSGQPLRYMQEFGYAGKLYPVNPKRKEVQGIQCYERVLAIPQTCDVAVITVAAPHVPGILRECGIAHIPFAVVLSAGFEKIGAAGLLQQQQLQQAIADSGVRVVGPNSTGVVNLRCRAYCAQGGALADATLQPGPVAVVAQSGGVGLSMLSFIQIARVAAACVDFSSKLRRIQEVPGTPHAVAAPARRILERTRAQAPKAVVNGILVQEMASGLEVILGAVSDPHFGPFVMFGIGGILRKSCAMSRTAFRRLQRAKRAP